MSKLLFAHVSWMPTYNGDAQNLIFSTHGWVIENEDAHEKWNYRPVGSKLYGYVPIRGKKKQNAPGEVGIHRLGAEKSDKSVNEITVIWFANDPNDPKQAYIVGWYRNATVFRESQSYKNREYRISCDIKDATLLDSKIRNFPIPHIRSETGKRVGYGYGQSSLWYADNNTAEFLHDVKRFIDQVDGVAKQGQAVIVNEIQDALDDLDGSELGSETPGRRKSTTNVIVRDNRIRRRVIRRAKGRCEHCGELGFPTSNGSHFVEAHHILSLARQGPDTMENVIALCPNHHREAHFGRNRENLEDKLLQQLKKLRGK